ncbi:fimbrial protein [Avibacterium paragallinarum]|uniref:Fimbrial protein n=2 Tax=Avibacterium paragallinarum TaxID=728 RepID=A0A377I8C8_AVIPA|nr:fimbrial protein [Avibacterium paragallinarum]POY46723.1 type 1 fimbrial protein [Avibacterium paragallinarum]RZN77256.1 type 1 fimbrial protein [Avibacterium paragallinarum]CDF99757.1 Putative fimbrial protein [Avibacterium paragallinarum JF4211]STO71433.1 fimbrial protein [Avibacterium paragallinarum]
MKKLVLTTLIGAALGFATQSAFADDSTPPEGATGLLTVKGKVVDTTCTVEGTNGPNIIVTLPTVPTSMLTRKGQTAGDTSFTIKLSNCTSSTTLATQARAFFYNDDHVTPDGRLENQETSSKANMVTVQLTTMSGTPINPTKQAKDQGADAYPITKSGSTGSATLIYKARYHAEGQSTLGGVLAKVKYFVDYM